MKLSFFLISLSLQQKVTLNNQNVFWGIVSACLPPQVFKVHEVSGN